MIRKAYTHNPNRKPAKPFKVFYVDYMVPPQLAIEQHGSFWYGFMMITSHLLKGDFATHEEASQHIEQLTEEQMRDWCIDGRI